MNKQSQNSSPSPQSSDKAGGKQQSNQVEIPSISLPKGGGAIKSIDDKFSVNASNGTAAFSIPFPLSPSRNGFIPGISLSYNSGSGNSVFGIGWNADPPSISRKTEKKLPEYNDAEESDTFIFSGSEDLVPSFKKDVHDRWMSDKTKYISGKRYKPRIEGSFAHIEKITEANGNVFWEVTSKDNIVSVFGKSKSAQIFDPANESKIFKWLFEFSYDDKGNCYQYEYVKENTTNVPPSLHEKNRLNGFSKVTNAYLKRVKYCNEHHFNSTTINFSDWENFLHQIGYLLELVLDYGEHDLSNPTPDRQSGWNCRADAFSDYHAGFEIRYYRLCERVLMFHHFTELGGASLVRSLNFNYDKGSAFTFLTSITQKGFIRRTPTAYSEKSLPAIEFSYEKLGWNTEIKTLPKESLENIPIGIDDRSYQWIDLYGEGLPGILTEQANTWYYKTNAGNGNFDGIKLVSPKPSLNGLSSGAVHFQDVEANGEKSLVSDDLNGYFEFSPENEWRPFKYFNEVPNFDIRDSNLKMLDLNGDGKADILISEEDIFVWYASKGKEGFETNKTVRKPFDEEKGPNIVFADSTQSIVLADMSGDGLMDIVRIRCNDIAYWPNMGYGKFGAKVNMSNAPSFDHIDKFNPKYIKLADIDGSGVTDIVYLGKDSFKIYFNQAGNSWSEENIVHGINPIPFSKVDDHVNVNIIDLVGNGTGCIVWSSPLPAYSSNPLRFIDLMNGKKPHIMSSYKNNMGKEIIMHYKPSTFFYLEDKKAGVPWITKLPFPVQCVSQVEAIDHITKTRFTNQYTYHHGYYDYYEREFRGFGRVDQTDTENFENYSKNKTPGGTVQIVDASFHEPPILTKTWFHTGAFLDKEKIFTQFKGEYYKNGNIPEKELAEPVLPADWTSPEWREALRACKGRPLRTEVYALDGTDKQKDPYTTTAHSFHIRRMQPVLNNKHGIFMVLDNEGLTYTYERNTHDPRIAHSIHIDIDDYGNLVKGATIRYGRKTIDSDLTVDEQEEQHTTHIIYTENSYTKKIDDAINYRLPLLCEAKSFELVGLSPASDQYFTKEIIEHDVQIIQANPSGTMHMRLIENARTLFLNNDLVSPKIFGEMDSMALVFQSYKLAITTAIVRDVFGNKVDDNMLTLNGKYVHFNDSDYWVSSGTQTYDPLHFYQVTTITDPFGYKTRIMYDANHHFFIQQTTDEFQNKNTVTGYNFRTLSPYMLQDINDNRNAVRLDELGMLMSNFIMGKGTETLGDMFDMNAVEASVNDKPSGTFEYNIFNYQNNSKPNFVKAIVNEKHHFDILSPGETIKQQIAYVYSDGSGHELMHKVQAEPDPDVKPLQPRWLGNGRTILNNKGKPVKQFEPYFSNTFDYEDAVLVVEQGVSPVIHYNASGRVCKTDMPDKTFTKVVYDAWKKVSYDQADNVIDSDWYKERSNPPLTDSEPTDPEQRAAWLSAIIADTPSTVYLDSLGRSFLSVQHNRSYRINDLKKAVVDPDILYRTTTSFDIQNNPLSITDARGNVVMQYKYDMLGNNLYSLSMDAGESYIINDAMGKPLNSWDCFLRRINIEYDQLHRPIKTWLYEPGIATGVLVGMDVYIDDPVNPSNGKANNLRGKLYKHYDQSACIINEEYDFKGNLLKTIKTLSKETDAAGNFLTCINWNITNKDDLLERESFEQTTQYDAMNRMLQLNSWNNATIPASIYLPEYNERGMLKAEKLYVRGVIKTDPHAAANDDPNYIIKDISYNEKGQKHKITYGNKTVTNYSYDKNTFRLSRLLTTGKIVTTDNPNEIKALQDLNYTYDAVGNIIAIRDDAQQTIFFANTMILPHSYYEYDALYRLTTARGREHNGQNGTAIGPNDALHINLSQPNDGNAMGNYTERYEYDSVGNILKVRHFNSSNTTQNWVRQYQYATDSNRLLATEGYERAAEPYYVNTPTLADLYTYNLHGSMISMPQLQEMHWDFTEHLQHIVKATQQEAWYRYDVQKQRSRKTVVNGIIKEERIYLGGLEIYRRWNDGKLEEKNETIQLVDGSQRMILIEHISQSLNYTPGTTLYRYQYSNHLGSASLELDEKNNIISYEEYHPFGTSSYQAVDKTINKNAKRYRYTGMERDEESGLAYHSARYYLPWLGRWGSCDPAMLTDGTNLFRYGKNNPNVFNDTNGKDPIKAIDCDFDAKIQPPVQESDPEFSTNTTQKEVVKVSLPEENTGEVKQPVPKSKPKPVQEPIARPEINYLIGEIANTRFGKTAEGKKIVKKLKERTNGEHFYFQEHVGGDRGSEVKGDIFIDTRYQNKIMQKMTTLVHEITHAIAYEIFEKKNGTSPKTETKEEIIEDELHARINELEIYKDLRTKYPEDSELELRLMRYEADKEKAKGNKVSIIGLRQITEQFFEGNLSNPDKKY